MVFGGEITFSTPPKTFSATNIFFRPSKFVFRRLSFFFYAPKTKNRLFWRAPKEQYFSMPKRKNLGFKKKKIGAASLWCSAAKSLFRPPKNILRRLFSFLHALRKTAVFRRQKPKIGFFGGRRRSKGLKVGFWVQPPYEPLAVKIVLRGLNGFRVFRGTHLEGPRRLRMKGS